MPKFTVVVTREIYEGQRVEVEADSIDDVADLAVDEASGNPDQWDGDMSPYTAREAEDEAGNRWIFNEDGEPEKCTGS
jgi:hypothetical protein